MLWNKAWSKSGLKLGFASTMELCRSMKVVGSADGFESCGLVLVVSRFGFVGYGSVVGGCGVMKPHIGFGGYELVWIHEL